MIAEQDEWLWGLFQPHAPFAEYASFLSERVTAGEISEAVLSAVEVTNSSGIADNWNGLLEALEQRLDASQGVNAEEGTLLLRALALPQAIPIIWSTGGLQATVGSGASPSSFLSGTTGKIILLVERGALSPFCKNNRMRSNRAQ